MTYLHCLFLAVCVHPNYLETLEYTSTDQFQLLSVLPGNPGINKDSLLFGSVLNRATLLNTYFLKIQPAIPGLPPFTVREISFDMVNPSIVTMTMELYDDNDGLLNTLSVSNNIYQITPY